MNGIRLLVFPCGSEIGLELHRALKDARLIELFGASSVPDHGEAVYKNYAGGLPAIGDPGFLEAFNDLLDRLSVDLIYPALDSVQAFLSANRERLHAALIAPSDAAVQICRSKEKTYEALRGCGFLPKVFSSPAEVDVYPVFVKPAVGQGSAGAKRADSPALLEAALAEAEGRQVIAEYLPGAEYTVDCFTDRHGVLRWVLKRTRARVKSGISVRSAVCPPDETVNVMAETIGERLGMRGAWFFQIKENAAGKPVLMECAPRVAGAMGLNRALGVDLPLLTVYDAMGTDVAVAPQLKTAAVDRALYNAFTLDLDYDEVYVDYDDTLVVKGRLNLTLLRFLYQCAEKGVKIILLTRHIGDVTADLQARRVYPGLFDEIVTVPEGKQKADCISPASKAIAIDDSFAERQRLTAAFGMPAFGPESVEALIDFTE